MSLVVRLVGNQLHVEGAISDAQWEGIVESLAAVGVNANAVKVACRFVPGMRRWSVNDPGRATTATA
jgi:hypothetical protein